MQVMRNINKIVVENILSLMRESGLNQRQLAERANLDAVQINRLLNFKRGIGPKSLEKISRVFGVKPEDLYLDHNRLAKQSPAPTVASLLQAMTEMEKELSAIKSHRLYPLLEKVKSDKVSPDQVEEIRKRLTGEALEDARELLDRKNVKSRVRRESE